MFDESALGADDGTKVNKMLKKGKSIIQQDTMYELHRLTESKAKFYDMLNTKVTDPYKVTEFDGKFRDQAPHHFTPLKPDLYYDREPMGYAGVIDKARPPPSIHIGGPQNLATGHFKMTPF
jgi:hypothetical protein